MFRLGIVTTIWRRPALTASVLSFYASLSVPGIEFTRSAAGSEGEHSARLARDHGFAYVETSNHPLSDKHNAALSIVGDVDAVMVVGSDDVVSPRWVADATRRIQAGAAAASKRGLHVSDGTSIWHCPYVVTGAGAVYSRAALDGLAWALWPRGIETGLDKAALIRASAYGEWADVESDGPILDIKTGDVNLFTMDDVRRWGGSIVALAPEWIGRNFPSLNL